MCPEKQLGSSEDQLEALTKKSSEEHVVAIIKAGLAAIPIIGGSLSTLLGEYYPNRQIERMRDFLARLADHLEQLEQQIKTERIQTEEFGYLLLETLRSVYRDYQQEKLEAYQAILLNTLVAPDFAPDDSELFLSLVRELAVHHIHMLRVLYQPQGSISEDVRFEGQAGQYVMSIRGVLHRVFAGAPEGFVDAIWTGLSAHGLVYASSYDQEHVLSQMTPPGKLTDYTDQVSDELPKALTPFGGRFIQFITDPPESLEENRT